MKRVAIIVALVLATAGAAHAWTPGPDGPTRPHGKWVWFKDQSGQVILVRADCLELLPHPTLRQVAPRRNRPTLRAMYGCEVSS